MDFSELLVLCNLPFFNCEQPLNVILLFLESYLEKKLTFLCLHKASSLETITVLFRVLVLSWVPIVLIHGTAWNTKAFISSFS